MGSTRISGRFQSNHRLCHQDLQGWIYKFSKIIKEFSNCAQAKNTSSVCSNTNYIQVSALPGSKMTLFEKFWRKPSRQVAEQFFASSSTSSVTKTSALHLPLFFEEVRRCDGNISMHEPHRKSRRTSWQTMVHYQVGETRPRIMKLARFNGVFET